MAYPESVDVTDLSPLAWRLLRVAAGYEQRGVERAIEGILQAHISMLESGNRMLSRSRRQALFDLYAAELEDSQIRAIAEEF
ncbi:hypothetical protein EL22_07300 [Halostagnicola sp. A56]|uniref:hypothetical protein n=1 Tax=Halostagnicola sp. A56 TaxID=1495067 RepID=UPI0004A17722|nr:hypothetical protein [Halostagnicola sp. A56]KDE58073.1 hypothetical protein EL22_07300 [Halostagnicola sp. A56]